LHLIDAHQTVVLIALNNQQTVKTVQDVGQMPFTEFSVLYAVSPCDIATGSPVIHHLLALLSCMKDAELSSTCVWQLCLMLLLLASSIW